MPDVDTAKEIVEAFATILELTGQAKVRRVRRPGGRLVVNLVPSGAAQGKSVSLSADQGGPTAFLIAPELNGNIVEEAVDATDSIETLPHLLLRAFSWSRRVSPNRKTSKRRSR